MPQAKPSYNTSKFQNILADYREDMDWNQTEAARYWGIDRSLYAKYETGYARIPMEFALIVCDELGLILTDHVVRL